MSGDTTGLHEGFERCTVAHVHFSLMGIDPLLAIIGPLLHGPSLW